MSLTVFGNNPYTTVSANGYNGSSATADAPATGTAENWVMNASASVGFPGAQSTNTPYTIFHVADPVAPTELISVTASTGGDSVDWAVTRGAENTTPVTHAAGATFYQVVSAGDLTGMKQATTALTSAVNLNTSAAESVVCTYQPVAGEVVAGTTFELVATGTIQNTTAVPTLTWRVRWGGLSGTVILSMVTGTNCPSLTSKGTAANSFDLNGTMTFISTTSAIANMNFWWQYSTATFEGVASLGSAVTGLTASPSGGPLVLTAQWGTSSVSNALAIPGPLVYRAA
jgi:hypothetical protein